MYFFPSKFSFLNMSVVSPQMLEKKSPNLPDQVL